MLYNMTRDELIMNVLDITKQPSVPEPIGKKETRVWVRAISRIRKCNNAEGFALVRNVHGGTPRIVKVFDDMGVAEILDVRPYEWLEDSYVEKITELSSDKALLREFLTAAYGIPADRLKSTSLEKATNLACNYYIDRQIKEEQ